MTGDFELTDDELRAVVAYVAESANEVLSAFESARPGDGRPRAAVEAAREFVEGARRSNLQRVTSMDAHHAARDAPTEDSRLAAQAAGDAAAAAYLHPIAKDHQVGHILRAAANVARIAELEESDDPAVVEAAIVRLCAQASPTVIDVLRRYPIARSGKSRTAHLMSALDALLRAT